LRVKMTLDEYLKDTDPNTFWKLSCGEHENLLDEAIERIEELEKQNKKLKAEVRFNKENPCRTTNWYYGQSDG